MMPSLRLSSRNALMASYIPPISSQQIEGNKFKGSQLAISCEIGLSVVPKTQWFGSSTKDRRLNVNFGAQTSEFSKQSSASLNGTAEQIPQHHTIASKDEELPQKQRYTVEIRLALKVMELDHHPMRSPIRRKPAIGKPH